MRQRADAVRNRSLLIEAGREVFAEHGPEAALEEIARRAGVGIGTLYRHFPSRDALVEAIYAEHIGEIVSAGRGVGCCRGRLGGADRLPRACARAPGPEPAAASNVPPPGERQRHRRRAPPADPAAARSGWSTAPASKGRCATTSRSPISRSRCGRSRRSSRRPPRSPRRVAASPADPARRDAARGRDAAGGTAAHQAAARGRASRRCATATTGNGLPPHDRAAASHQRDLFGARSSSCCSRRSTRRSSRPRCPRSSATWAGSSTSPGWSPPTSSPRRSQGRSTESWATCTGASSSSRSRSSIFLVGSVLCGLSQNMAELIAFRAAAGSRRAAG